VDREVLIEALSGIQDRTILDIREV
jgi:hypothetical protein